MSQHNIAYQAWTGSVDDDASMGEAHDVSWQGLIDLIQENDLGAATILDFGCNQGGFLRQLYRQKPFKAGVGIDRAAASVAAAQARAGALPLRYLVSGEPAQAGRDFDLAFSHEVLYLLPDLGAHARAMAAVLKPGGVYYIALGAHADNPAWPRWRELVKAFSPVAPQDYTLDDVARAFAGNGFAVQAQAMQCRRFVSYAPQSRYFTSFREHIRYYLDHFYVFRCRRAA